MRSQPPEVRTRGKQGTKEWRVKVCSPLSPSLCLSLYLLHFVSTVCLCLSRLFLCLFLSSAREPSLTDPGSPRKVGEKQACVIAADTPKNQAEIGGERRREYARRRKRHMPAPTKHAAGSAKPDRGLAHLLRGREPVAISQKVAVNRHLPKSINRQPGAGSSAVGEHECNGRPGWDRLRKEISRN